MGSEKEGATRGEDGSERKERTRKKDRGDEVKRG